MIRSHVTGVRWKVNRISPTIGPRKRPPSTPTSGGKIGPTARTNPFSHLKAEPKVRPEPERTREPLPPQVLLTWLRDNWSKPVISLRDLQVFGPSGIRDRKSALAHAETPGKVRLARPDEGAPARPPDVDVATRQGNRTA